MALLLFHDATITSIQKTMKFRRSISSKKKNNKAFI